MLGTCKGATRIFEEFLRFLGRCSSLPMASRDFLGVFGGGKGAPTPEEGGSTEGGESDEIELGLGLSLGGRFGTDLSSSPDAKRPRLARATSVASACSVSLGGDVDGDADPSPASPLQLLRTSSLPTDTEEERWRRREMQSRRRLEARRKMLGRRSSVGSSSVPGKPTAKEDAGDTVNGLQLRRSTGSQGSTSANQQEQGAYTALFLFNLFFLMHLEIPTWSLQRSFLGWAILELVLSSSCLVASSCENFFYGADVWLGSLSVNLVCFNVLCTICYSVNSLAA